MLPPETILQGRYRIVRQLGQGGMGAVYEAIDQRLDTTVALKETLFTDERLRKQFEREARLLARLHHPALPRVSDHFAEGDGEFLVMQFIAGDDLAEMISRRGGSFPPSQVLTWADQLLDAVDYLHTQEPQIIHRDIKPQNLKLTARGQIILLDFGLAKGQAGELSRITTSASIFGYTPNYAPLEQIQGLGTDARSDIYSLAATLYHLMTGVKPPDALTRAAAIVNGQPDPLQRASEANPAVSAEASVTLQKAMAQNREQRYSSAAEMRRALQGTREAPTVTNRSEAATVLFPSGTKTVSPVTPVAKEPTLRAGETTVVRNPRVSQKRRISPLTLAGALVVILGLGLGGFYAYQRRTNSSSQNNLSQNPAGENTFSQQPTVSSGSDNNTAQVPAIQQLDQNPAPAEDPRKSEKNAPSQTARKTDKAAKTTEKKQSPTVTVPDITITTVDEGHKNQAAPSKQDLPEPYQPEAGPNARPRIRRTKGGVVIRNFPDGTQLITAPDGTRVLVTPDGRRRVFARGERINRNRLSP